MSESVHNICTNISIAKRLSLHQRNKAETVSKYVAFPARDSFLMHGDNKYYDIKTFLRFRKEDVVPFFLKSTFYPVGSVVNINK